MFDANALRNASGVVFVAVLGCVLAWTPSPAVAAAQPAPVVIEISSPIPGEVVKNKSHIAPVRGNAQSGSEEPVDFDVFIAIDVSKSTRFPSGMDIDDDDELGFNPHEELVAPGTYPEEMVCSDPDDTILAAEISAARLLLEGLEPGRTQVGVIAFSGEVDLETGKRMHSNQKDAWVEVPLTEDFARVESALDKILARGPHGATNFAAAVHLTVIELAGLTGAQSRPRPGAKKVVQFLTDGVPTFPFGMAASADPEDTEAAISAARLARKAGITINTFALGRHALASPVAAVEMARLTVGSYTPVRNPGEILAFLQGVSFANIDDVVITNISTQEVSYDVHLAPDGTFSGFVPVQEGRNQVQVTVLATDGGEGSVSLALDFEMSGLTENELAVELERIKRRNKALMLELERKRIEVFRERQRKKVIIEAE
ncbi:MAG: VWA domain-containing protein [Deltaproteobacteria bacterium]|nr:VWA domain-containing protein [Deltaproteobacteria bacterium]MBW2420399.1 VWA domain-containing protein [Deltaproteobacteria bacterium]